MFIINIDYSISFVRCLSMIFIVLCHILQYYGDFLAWWFNVGVQIFVFISGFLYGQKLFQPGVSFLIKNIKKILIDYWIFLVTATVIFVGFYGYPAKNYLYLFFCKGVASGLNHLWFVKLILLCYLLMPIFILFIDKYFNKKYLLIIGGVIVSFLSPLILCFYFGLILGRFKLHNTNEDWKSIIKKYVVPVALLLNITKVILNIYFETNIFKMNSFFTFRNNIPEIFHQYSHILLGISLFILMYECYSKFLYKYILINKILKISDKYSYDVYLTHHMWILGPATLLNLTSINYINIIIVLCIITIHTYLVKKLVEKIN